MCQLRLSVNITVFYDHDYITLHYVAFILLYFIDA